jgi:hypothetical protein
VEELRHPHGERGRPTRPAEDAPLADVAGGLSELGRGDEEAQPLMVAAASPTVEPISAAGEFMAKYTPGCNEAAAISAIMATKASMSMPPYPTMRASPSFESSLGVVPEAMIECHPETAPQAMVMNRKGNRLPANTGPVPSMNLVSAGICRVGAEMKMAIASSATVPILRKVDR